MWRRLIIDAIRTDPSWDDGNYAAPPRNMRLVHEMNLFMAGTSAQRYAEMPTSAKADAIIEDMVGRMMTGADANNTLYALSASADYDPSADLEKIKAPLTAINTADDLINPPELGILEREIKRVRNGRAVTIPLGPDTKGHGSHTYATLWKGELADLLARSAKK
jgi:homoserine O-acetyltransferase